MHPKKRKNRKNKGRKRKRGEKRREKREKSAKEIDQVCQGNHFNDDTLVCLTQWTSPSNLGAECVAALPKEEEKDGTVDAEKAAWRAERKKARQASVDQLKEENAAKTGKVFVSQVIRI